MAHREVLECHPVSLTIFPVAKLCLAPPRCAHVHIRLTDIMQKAGNDDALALHLCLERRLHLLHSLPDSQGSPARVERMLYESALCIEVVGG